MAAGAAVADLEKAWAVYSGHLLREQTLAAVKPMCQQVVDDAQRLLGVVEADMNLQAELGEYSDWDRRLDQLHLELNSVRFENAPQGNCIAAPLLIYTNALQLSEEVFGATLSADAIPIEERERFARDQIATAGYAGLQEFLAISRAILAPVRPLELRVRTPEGNRYVEHNIEIEVDKLDPVWGPGVQVVDYFWRWHSGRRVFGARSFDYVEAFGQGFAANAAATDLPQTLVNVAGIG